MYYYRARWYDQTVGQFLSEDPKGFAAGDANLRRYVGNNAVNLRDPSGMCYQPTRNSLSSPTFSDQLSLNPSYSTSSFTMPASPTFSTGGLSLGSYSTRAASAPIVSGPSYGDLRQKAIASVGVLQSGNVTQATIRQANYDLQVINWPSTGIKSMLAPYEKQWIASGRPTTLDYAGAYTIGAAQGVKTGSKAIVNATASGVVQVGTIGYVNNVEVWARNASDTGYDGSYMAANVGVQSLMGVGTGALGAAGRVGKVVNAMNFASDAAGVGRGVVDMTQNGLTWQNGLQVVGGGLGVAGGAKAFKQTATEVVGDLSRYRVTYDPSFVGMGVSGVGIRCFGSAGIGETRVRR
jgi:hypothetical protein